MAALKIHVSDACKVILDQLEGYILKERGLTAIKGKGLMKTHWLIGKMHDLTDAYSERGHERPLVLRNNSGTDDTTSKETTDKVLSPVSIDSSCSTASLSIEQQPQFDARCNHALAYRQNEFDTLIKLNNLGAFTVTKATVDHHSQSSSRYPLVASVTPLNRNCNQATSSPTRDNNGALDEEAREREENDDDNDGARQYPSKVKVKERSIDASKLKVSDLASSDLSIDLNAEGVSE